MKTVGVLPIILLAMAMASADDYTNADTRSGSLELVGSNAIPQPATNPANVIFRIIQAPRAVARRSEQYVHQHAAQPLTYFTQPAVTRVVQQAVQPVLTRTVVQQPAVQQQVVLTKAAEPEPIDPNPSYNFGYEINAAESTVHTGHKESRSNGEVTGEYRVLDPNGNLRITRYTAGANGYNAEVEIQEGVGPVYQHIVRNEAEAPRRVVTLPAPAVAQPQAVRFLSSDSQQVLTNPYSYIRSVPVAASSPVTVRKEYSSAPAPAAFSSGTTFTRIVHGDGTTIEY